MERRKTGSTKKKPYRPRPYGLTPKQLCGRAVELGATQAAVISPKKVATAHWVRAKCQFGCGGYGSSLMCPPHSWPPEETRKLLDAYTTAILVHCRPRVPAERARVKELVVTLEREAFLANYYKAFSYGSGPCHLCEKCAFEAGCRYPHQARPCMEASGVDVYKTARDAGFPIDVVRDRDDEQNYYGLVLLR